MGRTWRRWPSASSPRLMRSISMSKWPELATMAPSCIRSKCSARSTSRLPGHGDEDVALGRGHLHGLDPEPVHDGLEGAQRVDLGHDDLGADAPRPAGHALAAVAVAGDHDALARQQHVGGTDDAVEGGLARAVAVVEHVLGVGVVDGHDRVLERALGLHGPQPDDTGRGLLGAGQDLRHLARAASGGCATPCRTRRPSSWWDAGRAARRCARSTARSPHPSPRRWGCPRRARARRPRRPGSTTGSRRRSGPRRHPP